MASRKKKKAAKAAKNKKYIIALAVILLIIIAVIVIFRFVKPDLFHKVFGTGEHTWSEWEITAEASCTEGGKKERACLICGETEDEVIPSLGGHSWGEWEITEHENCGKDGKIERKCSVCNCKEEEEIPATGEHVWGDWQTVTEPLCETDGEKTRSCSVCGKEETECIPAPDEHSWGEWEITEHENCGRDGKRTRTCPVCGENESETVPATGKHNFSDGVCTVCGKPSGAGDETEISGAELSIHFLELGNKYTGDCTLIKCGNTEVLIDAGSRQNSAATIKNYVDKYCTDGVLEYVIATHAHQDHIAGFVGSGSGSNKSGILYRYEIGTLVQFSLTNTTSQIYKNYCSAVEYAQSKGTVVYTAKQCWYETDGAKKQYFLDENKNISLNILYNYYYENKTSDENDYSVCTLLTQQTEGATLNYLFTGDLEESGESYLVERNSLPEVELFKGGHHGSYTASTDKLLKVIKPKNVAVCCCCGTTEYTSNKNNTFPAQAFIDRISKYTENIYCTTLMIDYKAGEYTSMNGNIVFYYDKRLKLYCSNNTTILKETDWFKANREWSGV